MMRRAVFLDRDGVLNRASIIEGIPHPPANLAEFEILPGVVEACTELRAAGFLLIVVTNQPDVARGKQRREVVEEINHALRLRVPVDEIKVCYHDDQDRCSCRKPLPGLLRQASSEWEIDLSASFIVGDRWKDIETGRNAGCSTILIDCDYREAILSKPDHRVRSLAEVPDWILRQGEFAPKRFVR
jgi:D-glycero-D-manno-heptose 1,7-bisphosphate phosphatase